MIFLNSNQSKKVIPLIKKLGEEVYGTTLQYRISHELMERIQDPMSIYATALNDERTEVLTYISLTIVREQYYQRLLKGEETEEGFEPCKQGETPMLFIRSLVVRDRKATPYVFRNAIKEIQQLCLDYDLYIHRCFAVASHWAMAKALKNYGFEEVGKYQDKYPIMITSRDKSPVMNSFLKRY